MHSIQQIGTCIEREGRCIVEEGRRHKKFAKIVQETNRASEQKGSWWRSPQDPLANEQKLGRKIIKLRRVYRVKTSWKKLSSRKD